MPTTDAAARRCRRGARRALAAWVRWASLGTSLAALACAPHASPAPAAPDAAPAAHFFAEPLLSLWSLSPDGRSIAALTRREGDAVLIERPVRGSEPRLLWRFAGTDTRVRRVLWSGAEVILVEVDVPDASRAGRSRARGLRSFWLGHATPRRYERWRLPWHPRHGGGLVSPLPDDPEHVLVLDWSDAAPGAGVSRTRVRDGIRRPEVASFPGITRWHADARGVVRAGSGRDPEGSGPLLVARAAAGDPFTRLGGADARFDPSIEFAGFDPDPQRIYVRSSRGSGRQALHAWDIAAPEPVELVFAHPEVDVGALIHDPRDGRLLAIEIDGERPGLHFFDEAAAAEQAALDAAFPEATNRIVAWDRSGAVGVLCTSGATQPPEYYLYQRAEQQLDLLFGSGHPALAKARLAPMRALRFTARDGLEIPAYLTLPPGVAPRNLPLVVWPHDGPTRRDVWGWNPGVQFLASRGFAVFQPNYRGSSGYGRAHESRGYGQWGGAMQEDLDDGVRWLVEQGLVDPQRVGIYGVGYGGYAALLGLARSPELYRAGASLGGVTDLVALLEDPEQVRSRDFNSPVALPPDPALRAERSPLQQAARIRAPVLLAHGSEDAVVASSQTRAMHDALEAAGASVELHLYRGQGHVLDDERERIAFHEALAAFFERHLVALEPL